MSLDFTAIDVETANPRRASICQIGLARFRDGKQVDHRTFLVAPPAPHDNFEPFNVRIHGITADHVAGAPGWAELLPRVVDLVGNDVVVAHNASFDLSVVRGASAAVGAEAPAWGHLCTMVIARRALKLPSYRLPFVLEALGDDAGFTHHDAGSDAAAAGRVAVALARHAGVDSVDELAARHHSSIRAPGSSTAPAMRSVLARADGTLAGAGPWDNPLNGRTVVFTGGLDTMSRQDAWDLTVQMGGRPESGVTKRTHVLVVGGMDGRHLQPGGPISGKVAKAFKLQAAGQPIEVMTEADFLAAVSV